MAAITRLVVVHDANDVAQGWADRLTRESADVGGFCSQVAEVFDSLAGGFRHGIVYFEQESGTTVTGATGTVTLTHANISNNDTLTLGGRVITWKTSGSGENEITIGADLAANTTLLVNAINNHSELKAVISASGNTSTGVVTITHLIPGLVGKHFTLATSDATAMALSATTLTLSASPTVLTSARTFKRGLP